MYPTINSTVDDVIKATWNISNGTVVPKTEDVVLKNGGRLLDATYLYADLAGSSTLAQTLKKEVTAKIIRAYINSASRILRHYGGAIRSFDGDRVMAIFIGEKKNWNAVRAAYGINWAVYKVLRPAIESYWSDGADFANIDHAVGIDTGEALIVRGGVRDNNDLISIGSAPNVAAKLSDLRTSKEIFITDRVYGDLTDDLLRFEDSRNPMWSKQTSLMNVGGTYPTVYGSSVWWEV